MDALAAADLLFLAALSVLSLIRPSRNPLRLNDPISALVSGIGSLFGAAPAAAALPAAADLGSLALPWAGESAGAAALAGNSPAATIGAAALPAAAAGATDLLTPEALAIGAGSALPNFGAPAAAIGDLAAPGLVSAPATAVQAATAAAPAAGGAAAGATDLAGTASTLPASDALAGGTSNLTGPAAGAATSGGAAGTALEGSGGGSASSGGLWNFLKEYKTPLMLGGSALAALPNLFMKPNVPALTSATNTATNLGTTGAALTTEGLTGQLPSGFEASVQNDKNAARAAIRSQYAKLGGAGSTSEAQDLGASDAMIEGLRTNMMNSLLGQGISAAGTGMGGEFQAAQIQMLQDEQFRNALSSIATMLGLAGAMSLGKS